MVQIIKKYPDIEWENIPLPLTRYRVHENQTSKVKRIKQLELYNKIIRDYIDFFCGKISDYEYDLHYHLIDSQIVINRNKLIEVGRWKLHLEEMYQKKLNDRFFEINNKWFQLCKQQNGMEIFDEFNSTKDKISYL